VVRVVRLPNWPDEAVEVAVAVLSKWRDGLRRRCGVNADALPLGLAPHKLVQTSPDGVEQIAGRFLSADLAEGTAEFLRQVSPQDTLHGDPGNAGAARSEGTGNPAIHRLAHERNALLFAQGMAVAEVETHTPKAEGRDFQLTFSKFAFLHFVSFRERISRPE
jgi:hypothetical protein